jgi:hypothetical protein
MEKCPFKQGDIVVYAPTARGRGLLAMTDLAELQPGNKYRIVEIYEVDYIVLEGFENAVPSAIFWSEFKLAGPDTTQKNPRKEDLEFLGYGPAATGSSGGWNFKKEIYLRCGNCGSIMHPWSVKETFGCTCGCIFLDIDAGRFSAQEGDDSVEVYRIK